MDELKNYFIFWFLYININEDKVKEIHFRNDIIKELFDDYYIMYISKINNYKVINIFYDVSKSEEKINFEKQINIWYNYNKYSKR